VEPQVVAGLLDPGGHHTADEARAVDEKDPQRSRRGHSSVRVNVHRELLVEG